MKLVIKEFKRRRLGAFTTTEERVIIRDAADMVVFPDGSVGLAGAIEDGKYQGSIPVKPEDLEVTQISGYF